MTPLEEKVIDWIKQIPVHQEGECKAYSIQAFEKKPLVTVSAGHCHALTYDRTGAKILGASFTETPENSHMTRLFWDWISGESSPWRKLHPLYPVYRSDGCLNGWYVLRDNIPEVPFNFIKNFMILTRTVTEYAKCFYFWEKLVLSGMDPADAMYLCTYFSVDPKTNLLNRTPGRTNNGGHWALTDNYFGKLLQDKYYANSPQYWYKFNWEGFRKGEINLENKFLEKINCYFLTKLLKDDPYEQFNPDLNIKKVEKKTAFSYVSYYDLDNIKEEFYSWQKKVGVLA